MPKNIDLKTLLAKDFQEISKDITYENGINLMEELTEQVESGELPLSESVRAFEVGTNLLNHLKGLLEIAEKKLKVEVVK